MADTLFADISYYQRAVNDEYPFRFITFRSNDGDFDDPNFDLNLEWSAKATKRRLHRKRRLVGFGTYFVLRDDLEGSLATLEANLAGKRKWFTRDRFNRLVVVIDVESWSGEMGGDHSAEIRNARERIIRILNDRRLKPRRKRHYERDRKRVVAYGNIGDLSSMAPNIGDAIIFLAAYGSNPDYPNKLAHQFADNYNTPPFGLCDINSADGYSPEEFAIALGIARPKVIRKAKHPKPHRPEHATRPVTKPLPHK